jgi:tetratricopeptide (TPR) repeat protein
MEKADYILLLDADMVLKVNDNFSISQFKQELSADAYYLFQGSPSFYYKNIRLIKNKPDIQYWGVTHEYIKLLENSSYLQIEKEYLFIEDIGDGGSKTEKFERDIELLKKGLEENPDNDRYLFYLANSYRDSKQYSNAIKNYKKRILLGGWNEEVWDSYYNIGKCYHKIGDYANAIYYWIESHNFYDDRIENLYEIIKHYREKKAFKMAYSFYVLANEIRSKKTKYDNLFLQKDIYDYKLDYELSILGYYCNWENYDIRKASMKVLACDTTPEDILKSVLNNYKFYSLDLLSLQKSSLSDYPIVSLIDEFSTIGDSLDIDRDMFHSSTPSICFHENKVAVNVRYVNYVINDKGQYINKDTIHTINVVAYFDTTITPWKKISESILQYDDTLDNIYVGLEDVRLFSFNGNLLYNCNRCINSQQFMIESGAIQKNYTENSKLLKINQQKHIEKNWVLFKAEREKAEREKAEREKEEHGKIKLIYNWYPLTICDVRDNECIIDKTIETPNFFRYVRGSTNGIIIGDEIWFLCHLVSYEDRRYYYHLFVVLDNATFNVKKYTQFFTFQKLPVEYTLGFIYLEERKEFLIGYSILDRETKYVSLPKDSVDRLMV